MKYSLVLAALSAAAIATPYVNVEVSEESVTEGSNHGVNHHHRGRHHEHRHGGWWAGLWSGRDRNGRSRSHGRRNDNNRRDRARDRSRDRSRNGGRRDRSRSRSRGRFDAANMMDDLFSTHYECVLNGHTNKDERRDTERCCNENGGELYDQQGHCIFRDVLRDPRDDWRDCALRQRGAEFAECYYREAREIDDELDGRGERRGDRDSRDNSRENSRDRNNRDHRDNSRDRKRHHRDHRNHRNGRNDRDRMYEQTVLSNSRAGFLCRAIDDDTKKVEGEQGAEEITRQCCKREIGGRFDDSHGVCEIGNGDDRKRFQWCVEDESSLNYSCRRAKFLVDAMEQTEL